MQIILQGTQGEIRRWIRQQMRVTGKKITYTGVSAENGTEICIVQEGTKEDYPRQRIVRKYIVRSEEICK